MSKENRSGPGLRGEIVAERDPDASARAPEERTPASGQLIPQPDDVPDDAEGAGGWGRPRQREAGTGPGSQGSP